MSKMGTVYLLHFDRPFRHARHYIGWTGGDLEDRLEYHRRGWGSKLLKAVAEAGIGWTVARTWEGTRHDERKLKNRKEAPRLCPVCRRECGGDGGGSGVPGEGREMVLPDGAGGDGDAGAEADPVGPDEEADPT